MPGSVDTILNLVEESFSLKDWVPPEDVTGEIISAGFALRNM